MTIKLLTPRDLTIGGRLATYPAGALVTLDSATEAGLVASKEAASDLTGGIVFTPPVPSSQPINVTARVSPLDGGIGIIGASPSLTAGENAIQGLESVPFPASFPLQYEFSDLKIWLYSNPTGGSYGITNKNLDTLMPGWRDAPILYVDVSAGSNGTGTTVGSPFNALSAVIPAANALGVPVVRARCKGGAVASRTKNFFGGVQPTCFIVWETYGGRSTATTHDGLTWAVDGTLTNGTVYKAAKGNVGHGVDLMERTSNALYPRLPLRSSAAAVAEFGGFYSDGTNNWVKRSDGAVVSDANTRLYTGGSSFNNFGLYGTGPQVGAALIGETDADGWDLEGGYVGAVRIAYTGGGTGSRSIFYAKNCKFQYSGSTSNAVGNVMVDGYNGALILDQCDVSGGATDLLNIHNAPGVGRINVLLNNCTGYEGGLNSTYLSNNFLTTHDTGVVLVAVGCRGGRTRGVTAHFIGDGDIYLIGCDFAGSLGDIMNGGGLSPCELTVADTVRAWIYKTRLRPAQACNRAIRVAGTARLLVRDCPEILGPVLVDAGATYGEW